MFLRNNEQPINYSQIRELIRMKEKTKKTHKVFLNVVEEVWYFN